MAHAAVGSEARLILAGRYSHKATQSEVPKLDVVDAPPWEGFGIQLAQSVSLAKASRAELSLPRQQETPNPLPDKYHTRDHYPFTDDEEYDPETEDEQEVCLMSVLGRKRSLADACSTLSQRPGNHSAICTV
jgi:hypothetical protein